MRKNTETELHATNSYTNITRAAGPSKIACVKCDAKKLPICICSKSSSEENEENESEKKSSASTEKTKNINSMQQISHFSTPCFKSAEKPNKEEFIDIKALVEQSIIESESAHNDNDGANVASVITVGAN